MGFCYIAIGKPFNFTNNNIIDNTKNNIPYFTPYNINTYRPYQENSTTNNIFKNPENYPSNMLGDGPWDEMPDRCDRYKGTIKDIDWRGYVANAKPKIILY